MIHPRAGATPATCGGPGRAIVSSDLDGIHFELDEHRKLGRAVAARAREILDRPMASSS